MIGFIVITLLLFYLVFTYNQFVRKKNKVLTNFSSIDVMLKQRSDLIPNLVESVKGYMHHEKTTLETIVQLRKNAQQTEFMSQKRFSLEDMLSQQLGKVLFTIENYPELKANENTMHLQRSLTEQEEQISAARRAYNSAVNKMNVAVESFPGTIVAKMFGFEKYPFFQADDQSRNQPKFNL